MTTQAPAQLALDFNAPYQRHSATSKAAAEQIEPTAGTLRRMVLDAIRARPMTDAELQEALGLEGNCERPRRREIQQAGLIEDSGDRRPTPSGRLAVVWKARGGFMRGNGTMRSGGVEAPPSPEAPLVYEAWWPFKRDTFDPSFIGEASQPTWVPGYTVENEYDGYSAAQYSFGWDGDGAVIWTVVGLYTPPGYREKAFYLRQWRDPDGKVFGKRNLRVVTHSALKAWAAGSKTQHLAKERASRDGGASTPSTTNSGDTPA